MRRVRAAHTKPEMIVRRLLHAAGFRFRLHPKHLPARPDIALPKWNVVLFVHGCFWHGHGCHLFRQPATRPEFWAKKIAATKARDAAAVRRLLDRGWRVGVVWECALRGRDRLAPPHLRDELRTFICNEEPHIEVSSDRDRRAFTCVPSPDDPT